MMLQQHASSSWMALRWDRPRSTAAAGSPLGLHRHGGGWWRVCGHSCCVGTQRCRPSACDVATLTIVTRRQVKRKERPFSLSLFSPPLLPLPLLFRRSSCTTPCNRRVNGDFLLNGPWPHRRQRQHRRRRAPLTMHRQRRNHRRVPTKRNHGGSGRSSLRSETCIPGSWQVHDFLLVCVSQVCNLVSRNVNVKVCEVHV